MEQDVRNVGKVVVVTSGKGGTGKSTVSAGLGAALCKRGRSVLLIDLDEGLGCLDLLLSVTTFVYDFGDLVHGNCEPQEAARQVDGCPGLWLMSAPSEVGTLDDAAALHTVLDDLSARFDYVILDSPAGVDRGFRTVLDARYHVIVVATPDPVSIRDAARVLQFLSAEGIAHRRLLMNQFRLQSFADGPFATLDDLIDGAGIQLIGVVPRDEQVLLAAIEGTPLTVGRAAESFTRIAARLDGENIPLPKLERI